MTDANLIEEFAKEALQQASKAKSENERLARHRPRLGKPAK